ncbi:MAG: O-antigen ligase family protein, partial [Acidimicrobiales bacterium]
ARAKRPAPVARPRYGSRPPRQRALALTGWGRARPLGRVTEATGIPGWALVAGVAAWVLMLALWAGGATKGSFAVFLATLLCAALATGALAASAAKGKEGLRGARAGVLVVLAAAVPVIFDPHTGDVFNLPKYTIVVIGALVLAGLWAIAAAHNRAVPHWRNGLQWVVAAIIIWTLVSALAAMDVHVGLLGNYGSYDGFYSAASFAMVMMAAAEAFDVDDVRRALAALAFAGGTVVVVYGLIQLHDSEVGGAKWDFIKWHLGSFSQQVFSTFGNPNHLAGYLAMLLPVVLVVGLRSRRWFLRGAAVLLALALATELLRSSARGAWVAAIAALVVLALMLAPELRRRPFLSSGSAVAVVAAAAIGMAFGGSRFLSHSLSTLFQSGGHTSVEQRFQIWSAAAHMAVNHPIVGIGPDNFALVYPHYQSASWVAGLGPNFLVNGAHDIFMNVLADQGFVGLVLFLALLAYIGARSVGAWRRLRSLELTETGESESDDITQRAQAHRALVAATTASITAYVVKAAFNVQQVGLSFTFWLLVG